MSRRKRLLLVGFALIVLAALPPATGQQASESEDPGLLWDPSGAWAMKQVTADIATMPIIGERTRTITSLLRVKIEKDEASFLVRETLCATTIDDGSMLVSTTIPKSFLLSVETVMRTARLEPVETSGEAPVRIVFAWSSQVLGARLDDPENDPLPTDPSDPRVFDQDGDGNPGMTVKVAVMGMIKGDVYVVQRNRNRLIGTVTSPDTIEGQIEWENEQVVLGASSSWFETEAQGARHPDPERHVFIARRIDDSIDCSEIAKLGL
jgi:hypothetical protein